MLKQAVLLEVEKNDRKYQLHLPSDAPLGDVHDVLFQMRSFVVERINESLKQDIPQAPVEGKEE